MRLNGPGRRAGSQGFDVFPNPAPTGESVWLDLPKAAWAADVQVEVLTAMGATVVRIGLPSVVGPGAHLLPGPPLRPGLYIVRVTTVIGRFNRRLVVY